MTLLHTRCIQYTCTGICPWFHSSKFQFIYQSPLFIYQKCHSPLAQLVLKLGSVHYIILTLRWSGKIIHALFRTLVWHWPMLVSNYPLASELNFFFPLLFVFLWAPIGIWNRKHSKISCKSYLTKFFMTLPSFNDVIIRNKWWIRPFDTACWFRHTLDSCNTSRIGSD